jgi:hypothetical protein
MCFRNIFKNTKDNFEAINVIPFPSDFEEKRKLMFEKQPHQS